MKRLLLVLLGVIAMQTAMAGDGKVITRNQLPVQARQTLTTHFAHRRVAVAKRERELFSTTYDVLFTDGMKVEFDSDGRWTEIDGHGNAIPAALVPKPIRAYAARNYRGVKFTAIERNSDGYEAKLDNGLELKFDTRFHLVDIDD